jgi:Tfp pilus assembly protein PilX
VLVSPGAEETKVKTNTLKSLPTFARQRGIGTLLVAIVLLGIVTVLTLFAMSSGVYEQHAASGETRYKLANETAQAGLDQGLEFMKAMSANIATAAGGAGGLVGWLPTASTKTDGKWQYCGSGLSGTSSSWSPCDTIEPGVTTSTTRSTYMYYTGGTANTASSLTMADNSGNLMFLDSTGTAGKQSLTTMGAFSVDYEVKALLCLIDANNANKCHTQSWASSSSNWPSVGRPYKDPATGLGPFAVTLVSQSRLVAANAGTDTENAQAVLKASTATYRIIGQPPDVPLVASSSVTGLGNAEIVTNPNGGGTGIPLSIWTDGCIHVTASDPCGGNSNASFATCQPDEFFLTGGTNAGTCSTISTGAPCNYQGSTTCAGGGSGCSCSKIANIVGNNKSPYGLGALSGHYGTNSVAGPDLLGVGVGGILPDTQFFPLSPLNNPPDKYDNSLFEYVFGTHVADSSSNLLDADGNGTDDATDFLQQNFTAISSCAGLNINSQGFMYTPKGTACSLPGSQIGTPNYPVTLVTQGDTTLGSQTRFFGIIFVRCEATAGQSLKPSSGTCNGYNVKASGGPQLYGAMIIEGSPTITGSPQLIYDANVLSNLLNGPNNQRLGVLPGSWSDAGRIDLSTGTYSEN